MVYLFAIFVETFGRISKRIFWGLSFGKRLGALKFNLSKFEGLKDGGKARDLGTQSLTHHVLNHCLPSAHMRIQFS